MVGVAKTQPQLAANGRGNEYPSGYVGVKI